MREKSTAPDCLSPHHLRWHPGEGLILSKPRRMILRGVVAVNGRGRMTIIARQSLLGLLALLSAVMVAGAPASAQQQQKPNIVFIMGDDIGWFNVGAYHRGIMSGKTPNLDKLAAEGMMFTDYSAEA